MGKLITETVTSVHHWNDTLFSFKTTRDAAFRFKNGHFVMIGLEHEGYTFFCSFPGHSYSMRGLLTVKA